MKILAIESSAKAASCALCTDGELTAQYWQCCGLTHSRTLLSMVEDMLCNLEMTVDDVDVIAVAKGPGSFTGIRIGVAAAKGLADVKKIPVCGTSTLESMAYNLVDIDCIACCVMDARCNQVYNAIFDITDGKITRLTPDNADSIENVTEELKKYKKIKFFVGDGAEICYNKLNGDSDIRIAAPSDRFQSAVGVCFCAMNASRDQYIDSALLVPEYLRLPQAERELNKKLSKGV